MQFLAPEELGPTFRTSVQPLRVPFAVASIAGLSNQVAMTYAGIPSVTAAVDPTTGRNGAADTGGTSVLLRGSGFDQATGPLDFSGPSGSGSQGSYDIESDTTIGTQTLPLGPGAYDVEVCTVTGCSYHPPGDLLYLYPPGNPEVDAASPAEGPAGGGTEVTISGENLGCVTAVYFGNQGAEVVPKATAILDCSSPGSVSVTAPPGAAGSVVRIRVLTVESEYVRPGHEPTTATFTYESG
jgi:hypothetical protein